MKNNLPKKSAAKAVKSTPATEKAVKKAPAAKPAKVADKPAAAKTAPKAKPATSAKPIAAKPATTAKPVAAKPATTAKPVAATKPAAAPKAKKAPAANGKEKKPLPVTTFVAQVETGWGNSLYLRGEGAPELSWERGILMKWEDGSWVYSTTGAKAPVAFKFLINDSIWAEGHNQHIEAGSTSITTPHFHH